LTCDVDWNFVNWKLKIDFVKRFQDWKLKNWHRCKVEKFNLLSTCRLRNLYFEGSDYYAKKIYITSKNKNNKIVHNVIIILTYLFVQDFV